MQNQTHIIENKIYKIKLRHQYIQIYTKNEIEIYTINK